MFRCCAQFWPLPDYYPPSIGRFRVRCGGGFRVRVGEGLGLGVGLGLGNQIAISKRGVIIWQGVENGHNTGLRLDYNEDLKGGLRWRRNPDKPRQRMLSRIIIHSVQLLAQHNTSHTFLGIVSSMHLMNLTTRFALCCYPDLPGTGCEHNGVIYRNGQSFQPSCKYQCLCVNGAIGCVSLCNESQPPRVWCQNPRRVKIPGRCCELWICAESRRGRKTATRHTMAGMISSVSNFLQMSGNSFWADNALIMVGTCPLYHALENRLNRFRLYSLLLNIQMLLHNSEQTN